MKKQILFIHGGTTFISQKEYLKFLKNLKIDLARYKRVKWSQILRDDLGKKFVVLQPQMPNAINAKYSEWKILFKKISVKLDNKVILLGHSLGAIFLIKYLAENKFPKQVLATILIAPPFEEKGLNESLGDFILPKNLVGLNKQGGKLIFFHSQDDEVVPFSHHKKFKQVLPRATFKAYKNRGHFNQTKFPELIKVIKEL